MNITDVRFRAVQRTQGKMCAVASVTIEDCFVIHDIKIFDRDGEYYIGMPSRKTSEGDYKDICHPLNTETRKYLQDVIVSAYIASLKDAE